MPDNEPPPEAGWKAGAKPQTPAQQAPQIAGWLKTAMPSAPANLENMVQRELEQVRTTRAMMGTARAASQGANMAQGQAVMTGDQAADLKKYAVMAKDVYNATKAENVAGRESSGVQRLGPDALRQLPGLRAKMENSGWKVDDNGTITQPKSGFKAAVYQDDAGKLTVSIAGTETVRPNMRFPKTWMNNVLAGAGINPGHDKQARDLVMMAQDAFGKENVGVTGHSAGGRAAAYAALKTGAPCVTFNADGLGPAYQNRSAVGAKINSLESQNITQVRTKGDWLKPIVDKGMSELPGSTVLMAGNGGHGMKDVLKAMENKEKWGQALGKEARVDLRQAQRLPAAGIRS